VDDVVGDRFAKKIRPGLEVGILNEASEITLAYASKFCSGPLDRFG
jgi:hypothetical protein